MIWKVKLFLYILCCTVISACSWENVSSQAAFDMLYLSRKGADMPVYIHGNVSSQVFIIVLHGGPGGNGLEYRPGIFEETLEPNYAMVYLDQRGQGMSQGHLNSENNSISEMVEDIKALTIVIKAKYGVESSLFLLGHSWGGTLGTAYMTTQDYQNEFKGWIEVDGAHDFNLMIKSQLVMLDTVATRQIKEGNSTKFWQETLDDISDINAVSPSIENFSKLNTISFRAEEVLTQDSVLREGFIEFLNFSVLFKSLLFSENPLTSYTSGLMTNISLFDKQELFKTNFSEQLKLIKLPTLLIWGRYDFVVPPSLGDQAIMNISSTDKKLVVFERSGHSPMSNEGLKFGTEVIDFVERFK